MDAPMHAVLEWDRGALAASCERAQLVSEGVETYLGRPVFAADGDVIVRVSLERVEEGGAPRVVARVSQRDRSGKLWGERAVTGGSDCSSLDEPLTLVVALMVDSPAAAEAEQSEAEQPEPDPEPEPEPEPPPAAELGPSEIQTAPSLERALETPGHAALLGFGTVAQGLTPNTGFGFGLIGSLKPARFWGISLDAQLLVPQRLSLGAGSLSSSLLLASANLCPLQGTSGQAWWSACGGLGVGRLEVESHGLLDAQSAREWLLMPTLSARAAFRTGRLLFGGGLSAFVPVSPDRYSYRDASGQRLDIFTMNQVGLTASLGAGCIVD